MSTNQILRVCWITVSLALTAALQVRAQDDVRITELMASNSRTIQDEDKQYSDWIEIYNAGTNTVNLLNWALTDTFAKPNQWLFPSTNLGPGRFMIVWATGNNRRVPGAPLHTNFKLGASGEYLALLRPDGTIATEFTPAFPPQVPDVSYGFSLTQNVFRVVATNAPLRALVPADGSLSNYWLFPGFDDSGWISGTNGIGFDTGAINPDEDLAASIILASFPLGYWRFNETNGTVATNLGSSGVNGAYQNVTLNIAGPRPTNFSGFESNNVAAQFNGASSSVNSGSSLMNNLAAFTLAGWFRPTLAPGLRAGLFGQNGVIGVGFSNSTTLQVLTAGGGSLSLSTNLPLNQWHHIAVVGDGTSLKIYLEGALQGTGGGATANYGSSASPFNIGGGGIFDPSGNFFNGQIDEAAVWARDLSAVEIQQQYQTARPAVLNVTYTKLIGTDLSAAMYGVNSSAYARFTFNLTDPSQVDLLTLRVQYDDGFVAYLNGVPVAVANAPGNALLDSLDWNATATSFHPDSAALQFEEFNLAASVNALRVGTNVLAIQGLNTAATNSDFLVRAELVATTVGTFGSEAGYFKQSTPGAFNGLSTTDLGPNISGVGRLPGVPIQPATNDSITVTARVAKAFSTVTDVYLTWRVMFGPTTQIQMFDDGLHGDGVAGDGVYGGTIPAGVGTNGQMLRWIVWAKDAGGHLSRWPLFENPAGSAEYEGTVIRDPNLTSQLPIYQIFIDPNSTNWIKPFPSGLPNQGVDSASGGRLSWFSDGELYDNIHMSVRGNTTAGYPKNSHHVNFNAEKPLKYPGPGGTIRHTSFLSETADPAYLRTHLSFWLLSQMGVPATFHYPVRFQLNGAFYGLYFHNDALGADELSHLGYDPDGALYKAAGTVTPDHSSTGVIEKRTRLTEGFQDFDALAFAINEGRPAGTRKTNIFDILNLPEIVNYLAVARWDVEGDDVWANMTMYRDSNNTKEWSIVPFDLNVSWGQLYCGDVGSVFNKMVSTNDTYKCHPLYGGQQIQQAGSSSWNRIYDVIIATPETRQMLLRRQRTLMDKFLQPPGTSFSEGILEQHISYMTNLMWTEMFLDRQRWGWPCSGTCGMYCWGSPWPTNADFGVPGLINEFINPRRTHWFVTHTITSPDRTVGLTVTNSAGIPLPQAPNVYINVQGLDYNPSSHNQAEEYLCVTNPTPFALDISGWQLSGAINFTFKPGTVMPSNSVLYVSPDVVAFRARTTGPRGGQALFVVGPYQGQLSARGGAIQIVDDINRPVAAYQYAGSPSLAQQFLRVTELMYHPDAVAGNTNGPEEFEYIELENISEHVALELTGVQFISGIDFNFTGSAITSLSPGFAVLIVKNLAAFTSRYGSLPNIAGQYAGKLNNGGDRIQLVDATGEQILDFTYDNKWYPITDGLGFSLVIVNEFVDPPAWNSKTNWRPSGQFGGSPVVVNEALTRSDTPPPGGSIELFNPTAVDADLTGWFLSDDFANPKKYRIPDGLTLPAGSYWYFRDYEFNSIPGIAPGFALNPQGGQVYLFSATDEYELTGYFHGFVYGPAENGVPFGRHLTSEGKEHFVAQTALTPATSNAGPKVGPLVINEIMYRPPDIGTNDNTDDEFIELLNISASPLALFDAEQPPNTWRITGGVGFIFPTNVTLAAGEYLLLVNFQPTNAAMLAAFRAQRGVADGVQVFGPYAGKLNNGGDDIQLLKPVSPLNGIVPFALVDQVQFKDSDPWPAGADGSGLSLQRKNPAAFGNDPANWVAALPTAAGPTAAGGAPPFITAQPASTNVVAGASLTLNVSATGDATLHYQWRFNGANIAGAVTASFQLASAQARDFGDYSVLVYNNAGSSVGSNFTVSVLFPPTILSQPSALTLFPLTPASFTVAAFSSNPLAYQWQFNGQVISGATNATYAIPSLQPTNDGQYSVTVTDTVGVVPGGAARLNVVLHPVFTLQPTNRTVIIVTNTVSTTFTNAATSITPITYQWRLNGANLTGATNKSLVVTNVQLSHAGDYSVVATDSYGSITGATATLTVYQAPVMTQQPQSQIIALGGTASFTAAASGTLPMTFRWRRNGAGIITNTVNGNTNLFAAANVTTNGLYNVGIANVGGPAVGGAQSGLSSNAYLYVMAPPTNQAVNLGGNATFSTAPQGPVTPIGYQWQFKGGNLASATNASLSLTNVQTSDQGDYSVLVSVTTNAAVPPAAFTASLQVLLPQPTLSNPRVNPNRSFQFVLQGPVNQNYALEISPNLTNWTTLTNLTATNASMPYLDLSATNATQRFYRVRSVP